MSIISILFRIMAAAEEDKEAMKKPLPKNLQVYIDISYTGRNRKYEKLDIYLPKCCSEKIPVILNVHGGGWVYGTKEAYRSYCLSLAGQGFAVVNMNYYLAPRRKFPTQLEQVNQVLHWLLRHAGEYVLDMDNLYIVGDSAGAQIVSQYATILTNPVYAKNFPFAVPKRLKIRGVGLNGGIYEIDPVPKEKKKKFYMPKNIAEGNQILQSKEALNGLMANLIKDYLGKDTGKLIPMLDVKGNITSAFPPTFLMTSYHDFLKDQTEPMYELLRGRGVEAVWRCYGTEKDVYMTHVCHTNMRIKEAKQMNQDELEFFKAHLKSEKNKEGMEDAKL